MRYCVVMLNKQIEQQSNPCRRDTVRQDEPDKVFQESVMTA